MADRIDERQQIVRASDEHAAGRPLPGTVGIGRRTPRSEPTPHAAKFRAVTAVLVGLAVGALVVALAIGSSSTTKPGSTIPWSSWSPPDTGTQGAREIADHVAPFYRISGVDQLAVVTVVNLTTPSTTGSSTTSSSGAASGLQVAVRSDPSSSAVSLLSGNTIGYNLCGIGGQNCAIGVGQPSTARLLLLRREALELALYTFKYVSGVQNVVAILPPGHTTQPSTLSPKPPSLSSTAATTKPVNIALLFLRDELTPWLSQPLSSTFPEQFPPSVTQMSSAPEAALVDQITARGLFSERLEQAQDGSNLIVLDPLPPQ